MTKKVALFVDNGGEELELIAPLDIMRRANLEVDLISANNAEYVIGAHNIKIIVDKKINDIEDILEYDAIVIPGECQEVHYYVTITKSLSFSKLCIMKTN